MLIPIVLSGGVDYPRWPVSREGHRKNLMELVDGQTLLLKAYIRTLKNLSFTEDVS